MLRTVAIVGRPNVGKSTLFNKIAGRRISIVDSTPGVTRDRLYADVEWRGERFRIVDTGGLSPRPDEPLAEGIKRQVTRALEESELFLFVIDGRQGITWDDRDIALLLRKTGRPVILVVNKLDDPKHDSALYEASNLGFEHVVGVSAEHSRNLGELLDAIISLMPEDEYAEGEKDDEIAVAIVGRPNVGKSSLLNLMVGQERSLVCESPGTTRDAIDSAIVLGGRHFRFIDTAGLRRRSSIDSPVEFYSTLRAQRAIDKAHVVCLVMDAAENATDQDKRIAGQVVEKGKGLILIINKCDLIDGTMLNHLTAEVRDAMQFVDYAPLLFISAKTGMNVHKIYPAIVEVHENWQRRIPSAELNQMLRDLLIFQTLPSKVGRELKIVRCSQVSTAPPTFAFSVNDIDLVSKAFERHIDKLFRKAWGFEGTPLRFLWRKVGRRSTLR